MRRAVLEPQMKSRVSNILEKVQRNLCFCRKARLSSARNRLPSGNQPPWNNYILQPKLHWSIRILY